MDTFSIFKVGNDRILFRECSTISADPRKSSGVNRAINKKAPQLPEGLLLKSATTGFYPASSGTHANAVPSALIHENYRESIGL
jgi:hypothetical protein